MHGDAEIAEDSETKARRKHEGQGECPNSHVPAQLYESAHNNLPRSIQAITTVPQKLAFVTLEYRVSAHFLGQKALTMTYITL